MDQDLYDYFVSEYEKPFAGWDFNHVYGRLTEESLPWDYEKMVRELLPEADTLLDMGTGGGELLASLSPLPRNTWATEGYVPNIPIARERLEPLGVKVVEVERDDHLPFPDETFTHVINKHESYIAGEVYRILKPGGVFLTQQVGGENDNDINRALNAPLMKYADWDLAHAVAALEKAGFTITDQRERHYLSHFHDSGALLYYLKAIPWQVPDFTVDRYYDRLADIHRRIEKDGAFPVGCHRFLVRAAKP